MPKKEFVDWNGGKCWGTQKLKKIPGKNIFQGSCKHDCRLKNECVSKSRELQQFIIDQKTNIPFVAGENLDGKELFPGSLLYSELYTGEDFSPNTQKEIAANPVIFDFVGRLANFYFSRPVVFDAVMKKLFQNKNISKIAAEYGISRQAESAKLVREILEMEKPKESFRDKLSGLERDIYQLCFIDGCTIRSAAKQLGISKSSVARLGQKISTKLNKSGTKKSAKIKKIKKKSKK